MFETEIGKERMRSFSRILKTKASLFIGTGVIQYLFIPSNIVFFICLRCMLKISIWIL